MVARRRYRQNVPNMNLIDESKPQYFLCEKKMLIGIVTQYWFIVRAQTFKWLFLKTLKSADSPFWRSTVDINLFFKIINAFSIQQWLPIVIQSSASSLVFSSVVFGVF